MKKKSKPAFEATCYGGGPWEEYLFWPLFYLKLPYPFLLYNMEEPASFPPGGEMQLECTLGWKSSQKGELSGPFSSVFLPFLDSIS